LTKKGERFFNNHFGTDILNLLFDNPSPAALQFLQKDIQTILGEIEPRIIVDSVEIVYPDDDLTNDIRININFFMNKELNLSSDTKQTIVLTVGAS
jgi:phage baseplate assembly protein W